nr:MAG TPA: hypothetical protein [Bacteriophage sp.]
MCYSYQFLVLYSCRQVSTTHWFIGFLPSLYAPHIIAYSQCTQCMLVHTFS